MFLVGVRGFEPPAGLRLAELGSKIYLLLGVQRLVPQHYYAALRQRVLEQSHISLCYRCCCINAQ